MDIFIISLIAFIIAMGLLIYWNYRIIKLFVNKRYKNASIHTSILLIISCILLWELRIIPLSRTNDFRNKTEELTGKEFWSWNDFRYEEYSVRGEGFSFEIYKLKPEIAKYFENPPNSFFENYPTDTYSLTKWGKTPIRDCEMEILEFLTPVYGNWNDNNKREIEEKQNLVKEIALENGSFYVIDTIIMKDATIYLISPEKKLIIWINHNM